MDDGRRGDEHGKQPIDHVKRQGGPYGPKRMSEEQRRKRSDAMKAFNRKTGKNTALGNARARMTRKPK